MTWKVKRSPCRHYIMPDGKGLEYYAYPTDYPTGVCDACGKEAHAKGFIVQDSMGGSYGCACSLGCAMGLTEGEGA